MGEAALAERHPATTRHTVIALEKAMGMLKKYLQLRKATAPKQSVRAHAVARIWRRVSIGTLPSCQASIAARRRNTLTKRPNPT